MRASLGFTETFALGQCFFYNDILQKHKTLTVPKNYLSPHNIFICCRCCKRLYTFIITSLFMKSSDFEKFFHRYRMDKRIIVGTSTRETQTTTTIEENPNLAPPPYTEAEYLASILAGYPGEAVVRQKPYDKPPLGVIGSRADGIFLAE